MPIYRVRIRNLDQSITEMQVDAVDVRTALSQMESQGREVLAIQRDDAFESPPSSTPVPDSPVPIDPFARFRAALERQWAEIVAERDDIIPGLEAYLAELAPRSQRTTLRHFLSVLRHPPTTPTHFAQDASSAACVPLLSASVRHKDPLLIVNRLIAESERAEYMRRPLNYVLGYSCLIMAVAFALLLAILLVLVPTFSKLFSDFNTTIPAPTRIILRASELACNPPWGIIAVLILIMAAIGFAYRFGISTNTREAIRSRLPLVGPIWRLDGLVRFTQYLSDLLSAEVSLSDSLRISGHITGRHLLASAADRLADQYAFADDAPPASNLHRATLPIPVGVQQAIRDALSPQDASRILCDISHMYHNEMLNRTNSALGIIEPSLILLAGAMVGFAILSLFLPLAQLTMALS